ncbi:unnamed protein product [Parajaminaea phylloscopi]
MANIRWFQEIEDLEVPPRETLRQINRIMAYNAVHNGWYPTHRRDKLWITDAQFEALFREVWNPTARHPVKNLLNQIMLLSRHVYLLAMHYHGIRSSSWVDLYHRRAGSEGRYLRWHMLRIRFLGYATGQPQSVVYGTVSGTKHARNQGDRQNGAFKFTSIDSQRIDLDGAAALVMLAILCGAFPPTLKAIIESEAAGRSLLGSQDSYDFTCLPESANCPVLLQCAASRAALKHPLDAATAAVRDLATVTSKETPRKDRTPGGKELEVTLPLQSPRAQSFLLQCGFAARLSVRGRASQGFRRCCWSYPSPSGSLRFSRAAGIRFDEYST